MAKRWAFREDRFLAEHFDTMGDYIGTHDLGRPAGAASKRVNHLKKTGAWVALQQLIRAEFDYLTAYHRALGNHRAVEWIEMVHAGSRATEIAQISAVNGGKD